MSHVRKLNDTEPGGGNINRCGRTVGDRQGRGAVINCEMVKQDMRGA